MTRLDVTYKFRNTVIGATVASAIASLSIALIVPAGPITSFLTVWEFVMSSALGLGAILGCFVSLGVHFDYLNDQRSN